MYLTSDEYERFCGRGNSAAKAEDIPVSLILLLLVICKHPLLSDQPCNVTFKTLVGSNGGPILKTLERNELTISKGTRLLELKQVILLIHGNCW